LRELFAFSAPSLLVGGVFLLEGLTPAFLLANAHPDVLAYFMTAATIVGYASVVQYVTQRVGFPAFSRVANSPGGLARTASRSFEMTALSVVTMVTPLIALSPVWMPFLFGHGWGRAAGITVAIGIAFSANACLYVLTSVLYAMGRPRAVLGIHTACLVLYVALAAAGTAQSVVLGAAAAYAVSRYAALVSAVRLVRRAIPAFVATRGIVLLLWGALASALIALAIHNAAWSSAAVGAAVFLTVWCLELWRHRAWVRRALFPWIPVESEH
jgi:PST family polysaccharide transporter